MGREDGSVRKALALPASGPEFRPWNASESAKWGGRCLLLIPALRRWGLVGYLGLAVSLD